MRTIIIGTESVFLPLIYSAEMILFFFFLLVTSRPVVLKMWSLSQQYRYHQGASYKCTASGPPQTYSESETKTMGPATLSTKPPGDSKAP